LLDFKLTEGMEMETSKKVVLTKEIIAKIKEKLDTMHGLEIEAGKLHFDLKPDDKRAAWSVTYAT
jgi:hypothetical protein